MEDIKIILERLGVGFCAHEMTNCRVLEEAENMTE
jgi:hypothetical protein